jgi:hypothetical protein
MVAKADTVFWERLAPTHPWALPIVKGTGQTLSWIAISWGVRECKRRVMVLPQKWEKTENQLLTLLLGVLFKDYIKEEEIWTELLFNGRQELEVIELRSRVRSWGKIPTWVVSKFLWTLFTVVLWNKLFCQRGQELAVFISTILCYIAKVVMIHRKM